MIGLPQAGSRLRFSLKGLLLCLFVSGVLLGVGTNKVRRQQRQRRILLSQIQQHFLRDVRLEPDDSGWNEQDDPWWRLLIQQDFFRQIESLEVSDTGWDDLADNVPLRFDSALLREMPNIRSLHIHAQHFDLAKIQHLSRLEILRIEGGWGTVDSDLLSLPMLVEFTNLRELHLARSNISDLSPLTELIKLQILDLSGSHVSGLKPIRHAIEIKELNLTGTQVDDLAPLQYMTQMRVLRLNRLPIATIAPLANMRQLERLELIDTNVRDVTPLSGASKLKLLNLQGTDIKNIDALSTCRALEELDLSRTEVHSLDALEGFRSLTYLDISDTAITDLTPVAGSQVTPRFRSTQNVNVPTTLKKHTHRW